MSLFRREQRLFGISGAQELVPPRTHGVRGSVTVTNDSAMRHSAVWACLRLRANLISTMPIDVYRKIEGIQVEMPKPPILVNPGGTRVDMPEWLYSSQVDMDRTGNAIGLITEVNALGLPARIDLQSIGACSVRERDGVLKYRIEGKDYPPEKVWHEKQYTVSGLKVGLSPIAYAAWTIGQYLSAQEFALDWYSSGGVPKGHFKNTDQQIVKSEVAAEMKARFKASVSGNDIFVTGKDWEFDPVQAEAVGMEWLEAQKYGVGDVARFMDCPGDLIDAAVSTGHITYATITQRNLQFLIMNLGPAVFRREHNLSKLLPRPRFVKLNSSALLRMDDETRAKVIDLQIRNRTLTNTEARALENRAPLTAEQKAEMNELYGPPKTDPKTASDRDAWVLAVN